MADILWSEKKTVQISVAPLQLVGPHQGTAAEHPGLVFSSCLYLERDFTWHLMRVFTCLV